MKKLENLYWVPRWVSHLGCLKGCLDFLGIELSDAWLFGATGHAFILNINGNLCPSGPTDWNTERFLDLGQNVGYKLEGISGWKGDHDLAEMQERAWDFVNKAMDQGFPCYGWELDVPEFYIINGVNDSGYYISGPGCDKGKGPIDWRLLGTSEIGVVDVHSVELMESSDDQKAIREALEFAIDFNGTNKKWSDGWRGIRAYEVWARVVEIGYAPEFGLAFNAAVWSECRNYAVEFLHEASKRLCAPNLDNLWEKAISEYKIVKQSLRSVHETYPFDPQLTMDQIGCDDRSKTALEALMKAKKAEATGLEVLAAIAEQLH